MALFKKASIHTVLFFLFLLSIPIKTYSQEQNHVPIIYQDTVILSAQFLPIVFDANHLNLSQPFTPECPLTKPLFPPLPVSKHRLFADAYNKNAIHKYAYNYLIKNNLNQIKYTTADFAGKAESLEKMHSNIFQYLFKIDYDLDSDKVTKPERFHPKRKYWIYNGNHKIQLSQNYMSQNWYKGGMKNLNLLNRHDVSFNYKKNKIQVNNFMEWKLNLYTNPDDTLRVHRIGEDLVRLYSDFGIHAINNWYYSSNIEIKTQVFKNFIENAGTPLSSIFSPLYTNIGFWGMKYQVAKTYPKIKGKKINFNMDISPLSIEYIAVLDKKIDPVRFGIKEGGRHLTNIGSKVNANLRIYFNKYVNFSSRFYYFTNYEKITAESENTFNMSINRYFSTSLYLFVRYDDNKQLPKDRTLSYFQINELLSFGFNYNW